MELWVLWSVALYIVMFFLVKKLSHYFGNYYHNKAVHLVMITKNSQHSVEWMIRSYHVSNKSKRKKAGKITCIDVGSTDDTLLILERLKQRYPNLEIIRIHPGEGADERIKEWLQEKRNSTEKWLVLDLRESDSSQDTERLA
ncbi:MAG: hypothetical protein WBZ33_15040 [Thermoactinomyces sp.]